MYALLLRQIYILLQNNNCLQLNTVHHWVSLCTSLGLIFLLLLVFSVQHIWRLDEECYEGATFSLFIQIA